MKILGADGALRDALPGELPPPAPPPPVTATPLDGRQWRYGLRRFGLLADVEAFFATLEGSDLEAAAQFESSALYARSYAFDDVLALIAASRAAPGFPAALDLTEAELADMWAQVLAAAPGEA